jgi:hypothetical protein
MGTGSKIFNPFVEADQQVNYMCRKIFIFFLSFLLWTGVATGEAQEVNMKDYVHRSEYEELKQNFEALLKRMERMEKQQLKMDPAVRQGTEIPQPKKADEDIVAEKDAPGAEPKDEKKKTVSLHLPKPGDISPGWVRAEKWRLAEPNQVPAMDARIAAVGDMDLFMAFDSVGRFQYLTQNDVAIGGEVPGSLEPGFQTPFGNVGFLANFGDIMDVYFDFYVASRSHPDYMQGGQGYVLFRDLPDRLKGYKPLDWVFETLDFKAGGFEIDFGDAHYRRSNNAAVQANPLIGNYVVDPRAMDIGLEVINPTSPIKWLAGFGSGSYEGHFDQGGGYSVHGKIWGDPAPDLRTSLSLYYSDHSGDGPGWPPGNGTAGNLFVTNRSGGSYGGVLGDGDAPGQVLPGAGQNVTATQLDLTWRGHPVELYGHFGWMQDADINGSAPGSPEDSWFYYAGEGIYAITDRLYLAGRYSGASARYLADLSSSGMVNRIQFGGGYWFLDTVLCKVEFVYQEYTNFDEQNGKISGVDAWLGPSFKGVVTEVSFGF